MARVLMASIDNNGQNTNSTIWFYAGMGTDKLNYMISSSATTGNISPTVLGFLVNAGGGSGNLLILGVGV
jgi:hypothetical protein